MTGGFIATDRHQGLVNIKYVAKLLWKFPLMLVFWLPLAVWIIATAPPELPAWWRK